MRIDRNSYGTIAIVYIICGAAIALLFSLDCSPFVRWPLFALCVFLIVWQTAFFRVPVRERKGSSTAVTAVADGKIVIIEKVFEPEFICGECIQISIFMDFWDVHANFWPVDGVVKYFKYYPGRHHLAFLPKASIKNEHTCVGIETESGQQIFFKQISGTFARRIKCYASPGLNVRSGEQCGIIKFGSRVDMFVPLDSKIEVPRGIQTRACETLIASLSR